ncbi:hypothetical protein BU24DRAFT_125127 [Aaosphaeria arxii CBS 175.79]|uniref:Uncharacterized protein n=1 Tax=Aaosphaeria arxii CBS 175.79 TaxID=1450172 RepID=A0A6A5Y4G0_9PLEO|nr:uncharacterized protein BU24DRAFT_125127 [Aaosphaeria arxii CBS 175.79]KAF2019680.1 hypothetical protein BU24DRAFT_125127 [Aaosphaeria arxii CBS 175.79]
MFAFQQPLKRARDDDSDSEDDRYLKKSRPFAFHGFHNVNANLSSLSNFGNQPSPPHIMQDLGAMTPAQSEQNSPVSVQDEQPTFSSPRQADLDMDMDMEVEEEEDDFDIIGSQPPDSPFISNFLRPAKLNFDSFSSIDAAANNTGRLPTPIFPTFNGPRGPMNTSLLGGVGYPSSGLAGGLSMDSGNGYLGVPQNPLLQKPPTIRKQAQVEHDRSRRMPSPISEDEDIPDTPTALTQSQLSRLSVTSNAERMDLESQESSDGLPPPPGVLTTPSRGRKRSGALSGKGRFSMGYRDDCEKCRQRVPGHYSHFLP